MISNVKVGAVANKCILTPMKTISSKASINNANDTANLVTL